ncbi:MAG TPA: 3-oxoacyl-[acyl-carrier-protein] reductase [Deltaproteobacteria bacterium]|nr:3-oxoacyl-[acyl-carrier-protein] reductase [Deltaproteobacteria bacterium]
MDFNGKTVLITGAARGIGKTIALQLADQGADIAFTDLSDEVEAVKSEIESRGRRCLAFQTNVTDAEAVDAMVKEIVGAWERIDILVNNAGITRDNLFLRMKLEEWAQVVDINLNGVFNVTRAAIRPMVKQRYGRVVSLSSVVGFSGNPGQVNYSSTKAALVGFTKSLAREVGARGVTVNLVAPGFIDTAMTQKLNEDQQSAILQQVPLGRMGSVEDIANAVAFLSSDQAAYITGTTLHVNGGIY